mgnify:CR=1 FL=1
MESSQARKSDTQSEVAKILIEAMKEGQTPWQKPWSSSSMRPMNPTSGNAYRGINRVLLGLSGRDDPRWMTYQQASQKGWQVRRGEKGSSIVKLVEVSRISGGESGGALGESGGEARDGEASREGKALALRRYTVFNAAQIDGVPPMEERAPATEFETIARAESVLAALKETGLLLIHGGSQACYIPARDEIRMPARRAFHSAHDYYATLLHEGAHSTLHPKRLDRKEALGKRWGDEAYSQEELRAEICSAILAAETGVPMSESHIRNHAAYLNSWIANLARNPMAIFSAAKDAEAMASYMLALEAKFVAAASAKDWVADYVTASQAELAPERSR